MKEAKRKQMEFINQVALAQQERRLGVGGDRRQPWNYRGESVLFFSFAFGSVPSHDAPDTQQADGR